jgi:putative component of toxin-antitoxin plasmid stabilization module
MIKFALEKIESVKGKQTFMQLTIYKHGVLNEFENDLKDTTYLTEYKTILAYMNFYSNNNRLPKTKFRMIEKGLYEFKTKHLRIYCTSMHDGSIVILCGYKNEQDEDITKAKKLKEEIQTIIWKP